MDASGHVTALVADFECRSDHSEVYREVVAEYEREFITGGRARLSPDENFVLDAHRTSGFSFPVVLERQDGDLLVQGT